MFALKKTTKRTKIFKECLSKGVGAFIKEKRKLNGTSQMNKVGKINMRN